MSRPLPREPGAPVFEAAWEPAPAKVNLFLHVVGRRRDGYHLLDSLVVFAGIGDSVQIQPEQAQPEQAKPHREWALAVAGRFADGLAAGSDNLVNRAAQALSARHAGHPARLLLTKRLPVAAGLGGGSADAAATLRLLARLWGVTGGLDDIAATLGADVPVCLQSRPARMAGIGEILTPAPLLPEFGLALVNPGVGVRTADVFAAGSFPDAGPARLEPACLPAAWDSLAGMAADVAELRNDLEPPARRLAPIIAETLAALARTDGCRLARMSGSGSTCFGLFDDPATAAAAARELATARPEWWCWGGGPASLDRDVAFDVAALPGF